MIAAVTARLEARVPDLAKRIDGALDFADLLRRGALPQHTPAAHIIPLNLQGGKPDAATGLFTQMTTETLSVMLTVRKADRTRNKGLIDLRALVMEIINALAGWEPGDEVGVFQLSRGHVASMNGGAVVYQIDFSIADQLRITP